MSFFNRKHKQLALSNSKQQLETAYKLSEKRLKYISLTGNEKQLKKAMKEHGKYEYAMLYQNTPEFNKKRKNYLK